MTKDIVFIRSLRLLCTLAVFAGGASEPQPLEAQGAAPRNVVFILTDDQRYDAMGFHPGAPEWLETPNLDRMARGGVHLANAFVTTALCSPSRASILTGQLTHRHGVVDNARDVPSGTRYFPEYLQQSGYRTAFIGKWHMGSDSDAPRPGFDRWISFRGQGVYNNPVLNVDGGRVERTGYTTDILNEYALEWLETQRRTEPERPFFLYLSHKAVHSEFIPAPRHQGRYKDAKLTYPETMRLDAPGMASWPDWVKAQRSSWHGVDFMYHGALKFDDFFRQYAETLLAVDDGVGRVLDYLERTGLDRNTLVIFMGDNGFSFGEHGLIDKRHAFEESIRVPMLAWAPGFIAPGRAIPQMVMNMDVMPTVLDLAGVTPSAEHTVDGKSFLPLLRGESVPWRTEVFYEYYWEWNFPQTPTQFALRTDRYKYINFYGLWGQDALFDLVSDPQEAYNLIGSPEHQEIALDLRGRLFRTMEQTRGMVIPLREPVGGQNARRRPEGSPSTDPFRQTTPN